jgi:hypothetical protein
VSSRHLENYGPERNERCSSPETGSTSTSSKKTRRVDLKYGDEGFQELLKSNVDAIYVIVLRSPNGLQVAVLEAGKLFAEGSCFYFI